ncbi:MAG: hypothetical protein HOB93_06865 [Candidatus Marinimicrobia bacterium]|jgi:hypothetical protein|nr:hypothetical protein [Candidatus Neomarinimicrobiota bacterium]MBT7113451.1 hypothetical protein [Candidatus Neomarinimicrobiota bacterium]
MKFIWITHLLLWWNSFLKRRSHKNQLIKINKKGRGASKILFLLPAEKEHAPTAAYFLKKDLTNTEKKFMYIVHEDGLAYYEYLSKEFITFNDQYLNWIGLMNSTLILDEINAIGFDAVVDLNQTVEQPLSILLTKLDISIKIGFQSQFADSLYTMIIQPSPSGFLENNYETIERLLDL